MGLILDTSALVAWDRAIAGGRQAQLPEEEIIALPAIVWAEALVGVRMADTPLRAAQRRARLEVLRRVLDIEPFTPEIAEHYADIYAELTAKGTLIPQNDISVAATARALRFGVLVGPADEADFARIAGLEVRVLTVV